MPGRFCIFPLVVGIILWVMVVKMVFTTQYVGEKPSIVSLVCTAAAFGLLPGPIACRIPIAFMRVKYFTCLMAADIGEVRTGAIRAVAAAITLDLNNLFIIHRL